MSETRLPPLLLKGIDLFNRGDYYDCHEVLEQLWNEQQEPEKQLTQALIQVAVATYHIQRSNFEGARKLYERGLRRLRPFVPTHAGIDVAALIKQCEHLQALAHSSTIPGAGDLPRISVSNAGGGSE